MEEQRGIISEYEDDMIKYTDDADKARIRECFESIPQQLSKENKKFQYSVVRKNGKASQYLGSIQWIEDAGIINRCYNLNITELPLDGNSIPDTFKIYMADTGLFVSMKAKDGNTKSTKTILAHPEKYHVTHAIKLGDYNIGKNGSMLILPLYMAFLLKEY